MAESAPSSHNSGSVSDQQQHMPEAVVLAGGFGTRLRTVVADVPKPMAPVKDSPFLSYVLRELEQQGIKRVILAIGYLGEKVQEHYGDLFGEMEIVYSVEDDPLGTGGGIKQAIALAQTESVFVLNGDTFFAASLAELNKLFVEQSSSLTIALKEMRDFERYGTVIFDEESGVINGFQEKQPIAHGYINGGVYLMRRDLFEGLDLPEKFSFEKEILEAKFAEGNFHAVAFDSYFIDIGIPEDYATACESFDKL